MKDAQFCSAEHRALFYEAQQAAMLRRLQNSASRLLRHRSDQKPRTKAEPEPIPVSVSEPELVAPAPLAPGAPYFPHLQNRAFDLLSLGALDNSAAQPTKTERPHRPLSARVLLAPAIPCYPWPLYNPAILNTPALLTVTAHNEVDWSQSWAVRHRGQPADSLRYTPLIRVAPTAVPPPPALLRSYSGELPHGFEGAASCLPLDRLCLDHTLRARGLVFLDRVFRMRPRSGVNRGMSQVVDCGQSADFVVSQPLVTGREHVPAPPVDLNGAGGFVSVGPGHPQDSGAVPNQGLGDWVAPPAEALRTPSYDVALPSPTFSVFRRFARMRPTPVQSGAVIHESAQPADRVDGLDVRYPGLRVPDAGEFMLPAAPARVTSSNASCAATPPPSAVAAIEAASESHAAVPGIPAFAGGLNAPVPTHGAAIAAHGSGAESRDLRLDLTIGESLPATDLRPVLRSLRVRGMDVGVPGISSRLFKARPRAGVEAPCVPLLALRSDAEAFPAEPLRGSLAGESLASPALSNNTDTLHLIALPSTDPVQRASHAALETPSADACAPATGSPLHRSLIAPRLSAAPRAVERFFRPRPRGPVGSDSLPQTVSEARAMVQRAAETPQPAVPAAQYAPSSPVLPNVSRFAGFRLRPQLLRNSSTEGQSGFEPDTEALATTGSPAVPNWTPELTFEPLPTQRMFRMRPRSGVDAATSPAAGIMQPELMSSAPVKRGMPATAPGAVALGRTESPVHRGLSAIESLAGVKNIEAATDSFRGQTRISSLRATIDCGLVPSQRLFRMRPRAGITPAAAGLSDPAVATSTAHALASPPVTVALPGYPADLLLFEPQRIERLFRMRPRAGLEMPMVLLEVAEAPYAAATAEPAWPHIGINDPPSYEPAFANRFFRIRPRLPKQDVTTLLRQGPDGPLALPDAEVSLPSLPTGLWYEAAPAPIDRLYRMRPRIGKQAAASILPISVESIDGMTVDASIAAGSPVDAEQRVVRKGQAVLEALSDRWNPAASKDLKVMVATIPVMLCLTHFVRFFAAAI